MEKRGHLQGYLLVAIAGSLWGIYGFFVTKMSVAGACPLMTAFASHFFAFIPIGFSLLTKTGQEGLKISKKGFLFS